MAIVVSQLVSAAMLQDFIIGKNALPLAGGIITMYRDSDQVTLKNWYYQTGVYGNYQYVALPNPLVLSAAGTIQDVNGNDVIPFYYPYVDPPGMNQSAATPQAYFVTVYDAFGTLQFTRSNFPFEPPAVTPTVTTVPSLENYIINGRFWRNIGSVSTGTIPATTNTWTTQYNNTGSVFYETLAPDNHDGFSMPDFNYIKNVNGSATETITFDKFAEQQTPVIVGDIQPEYYINYNCIADSSGASVKAFQYPISLHLATLSAQTFTFTIQAQLLSGTSNAALSIFIYAFQGSGVPSNAPVLVGTIPLSASGSWQKYTVTNTFPATLGLGLSATNDDAYYLQINMPTGANAVVNLNFCVPSLYLSSAALVPTNSFSTYDQIDTIVTDPRTGDVRTSVNSFYPYGWVPMNDGLIALTNPSSNAQYARANSDTWPLFNMLWTLGKTYDTGSDANPVFQMFTNTSGTLAATNYGANAYADFTAASPSKALQLPFSMGQVFLGTVPIAAILPSSTLITGGTATVTASNPSGSVLLFTVNSSLELNVFTGNTIVFTSISSPIGNITANTIYYMIYVSATTFYVSTSFQNAVANTSVLYSSGAASTATATVSITGSYEGEYAHTQLLRELAQHTHNAPSGAIDYLVNQSGGGAISGSGFLNSSATITGTVTNYVGAAANVTQPGTFFNIYIKL